MASYFVRYTHPDGRLGWSGPLGHKGQAEREHELWVTYGCQAQLLEATPEVKRTVKAWRFDQLLSGRGPIDVNVLSPGPGFD